MRRGGRNQLEIVHVHWERRTLKRSAVFVRGEEEMEEEEKEEEEDENGRGRKLA